MTKSLIEQEQKTTQEIINEYHNHNAIFESKRNSQTRKTRKEFYAKIWINLAVFQKAKEELKNRKIELGSLPTEVVKWSDIVQVMGK